MNPNHEWSKQATKLPIEDRDAGGVPKGEEVTAEKEAIDEALAKVDEFLAGGKAAHPRTALYLGVGVGNPETTWMNESERVKEPGLLKVQLNPPVLDDLEKKGYHVVGLNFNVGASTPLPEPSTTRLHLHVNARFPLSSGTTATKAVRDRLKAMVGTFDRVIVLNAVSQLNYSFPVELVATYSFRPKRAFTHYPTAYVRSYAQTGEQVTYASPSLTRPENLQLWKCSHKPTGLQDEDDVFHPLLD